MTTKQHLLLAAIIASQSLNTSLAQTWLTSGNLSTKNRYVRHTYQSKRKHYYKQC
jgi:hypothetical protein